MGKCIHGFKYQDECAICLGKKITMDDSANRFDVLSEMKLNEHRFLSIKRSIFPEHDPYPYEE